MTWDIYLRLIHEEGTFICDDEQYNYYHLLINACNLIYRTNRYRTDGRRAFKLDNALAKLLGFISLEDMCRCAVKGRPRFWLGYLSPQALLKHYGFYNGL